MAEMYIQGVSTRKVTELLQARCGLRVSSSQVSRAVAELDPQFHVWKDRPIAAHPYVLFDARFEKVCIDGSLRDRAVVVAIGISEDGYRAVLGASCALSEAEVHWRTFLESLHPSESEAFTVSVLSPVMTIPDCAQLSWLVSGALRINTASFG